MRLNSQHAPEEEQPHSRKFSDEGAANLLAFFDCVHGIIERLLSEGYTIQDDKLVPPHVHEQDPINKI